MQKPVWQERSGRAADAGLRDGGLRAVSRCDALVGPRFSQDANALTRPYLTPAHRNAIAQIGEWMSAAGMSVRIDAVGNLIGRYEGATPEAPALILGSHIDSVPDGGRYDGPLGVMIGLECVARFSAAERRLPFALEVIAFGDEEGSRFPTSMFCSRAVAGLAAPESLDLADSAGCTVAQALTAFGLDPSRIGEATRSAGEVIGYVEAHIEQGPVLETENLPVGVVTSIASQLRFTARFEGAAAHAGTTPMRLRRDAIAAAAAGILAVEEVAAADPDTVGTVGRIVSSSNAFNVIAGEAEISVDLRAATRASRDAMFERLQLRLRQIVSERNVGLTLVRVQDLPECRCDPGWVALLEAAVEASGVAAYTLMSGAGHDAMSMAGFGRVGMLFVRCAGGISHNPAESVDASDVGVAILTLMTFLDRLSDSFQ